MRRYKLLNISCVDRITNEELRKQSWDTIAVHDDLLAMVKKPKLRCYSHMSRSSGMADNSARHS